jgi:uncharacterized delta-60 repeat protein
MSTSNGTRGAHTGKQNNPGRRLLPRPLIRSLSVMLLGTLLVSATWGCTDAPAPTQIQDQPTQTTQTTSRTATRASAPRTTPTQAPSGEAGQLDPTFGSDGMVTTDMGSDGDIIHAMAIQEDGKIVVAGESWPPPERQPHFALARYNPDGSLDTTFGDDGTVLSNMVEENDYSMAYALALAPGGKILVAGSAVDPEVGHKAFALARYNGEGSLDKTFGKGGRTLVAVSEAGGYSRLDEAYAVALAPDGKIVVAGATGDLVPDNIAVVRFSKDGKPDKTFGKNGVVVTDSELGDDIARAVIVQEDGKIVVGGNVAPGDGNDNFGIVRYTTKGTVDTTFGKKGFVSTAFPGDKAWGQAMIAQPDGKITLTGYVQVPNICAGCSMYGIGLARYNPDGSLDKAFGNDGTVLSNFTYSAQGAALTALPDGRLVVAGTASVDDFGLAIYTPDGRVETAYALDGLIVTNFAGEVDSGDHAYAVAVQPDGKIVAAGTGATDEHGIELEFALARYQP